jgi:hypothetical protein
LGRGPKGHWPFTDMIMTMRMTIPTTIHMITDIGTDVG